MFDPVGAIRLAPMCALISMSYISFNQISVFMKFILLILLFPPLAFHGKLMFVNEAITV